MPRKKKSSRKSSKRAASDEVQYPSGWSEWERDDEDQTFGSFRLTAPGQYEWRYSEPMPVDHTPSDLVEGNSSIPSNPTSDDSGTLRHGKGKTAPPHAPKDLSSILPNQQLRDEKEEDGPRYGE